MQGLWTLLNSLRVFKSVRLCLRQIRSLRQIYNILTHWCILKVVNFVVDKSTTRSTTSTIKSSRWSNGVWLLRHVDILLYTSVQSIVNLESCVTLNFEMCINNATVCKTNQYEIQYFRMFTIIFIYTTHLCMHCSDAFPLSICHRDEINTGT